MGPWRSATSRPVESASGCGAPRPATSSGACRGPAHRSPLRAGSGPVRTGGELAGRVPSGGYGYAVERSIAYASLPPDAPLGTRGEIDVFGEWTGFEVMREPLYDPGNERIR